MELPTWQKEDEFVKTTKPFEISKAVVWQAWHLVKASQGAAGADGVSLEQFEAEIFTNYGIECHQGVTFLHL